MKNNNKQSSTNDDNILGEYYYVTNDEIKSERLLDLMKDGTFYYFTGATCSNTGYGKYKIIDKKLILNFDFLMNCGGSIYMKKNNFYSEDINITSGGPLELQKEYLINDDNSISLSNDTNNKIKKTSDNYEHFYYYNDSIITSLASLLATVKENQQ